MNRSLFGIWTGRCAAEALLPLVFPGHRRRQRTQAASWLSWTTIKTCAYTYLRIIFHRLHRDGPTMANTSVGPPKSIKNAPSDLAPSSLVFSPLGLLSVLQCDKLSQRASNANDLIAYIAYPPLSYLPLFLGTPYSCSPCPVMCRVRVFSGTQPILTTIVPVLLFSFVHNNHCVFYGPIERLAAEMSKSTPGSVIDRRPPYRPANVAVWWLSAAGRCSGVWRFIDLACFASIGDRRGGVKSRTLTTACRQLPCIETGAQVPLQSHEAARFQDNFTGITGLRHSIVSVRHRTGQADYSPYWYEQIPIVRGSIALHSSISEAQLLIRSILLVMQASTL